MTEPKSYPNARDCEHGSQRGKCVTCDLAAAEKRLEEVEADRAAALARFNAGGVSHGGKLDMGVTIALELIERLKKQLHEEDMTRCDLEADLQTFGGVSIEDGLRAGVFELINLYDALKVSRADDLRHFGEKVAALCETRAGCALVTTKEFTNMLETK